MAQENIKTNRRSQLLINRELQLSFMAYMFGLALMSCVLTVAAMQMVMLEQFLENVWAAYAWISFLTVLMIACWAVVILFFTNRIFGPLYRLHKEIKNWKSGETVVPITLRKGDHFVDLIDDFNEIATKRKA